MSVAASGLHLTEVGQIALTVQDLARAKEFYGGTLGLRALFDAGTMAFFQCGPVRMMVGTPENASAERATILYFKTPDIQEAHRELQRRAVKITQEPHLVAKMPDHDLWMCGFEDPDGNPLVLMSEVRRAEAPS